MTDESRRLTALTGDLRAAADLIERICKEYGYSSPERGEWSAKQLRYEADYLDRAAAQEAVSQ